MEGPFAEFGGCRRTALLGEGVARRSKRKNRFHQQHSCTKDNRGRATFLSAAQGSSTLDILYTIGLSLRSNRLPDA